MAITVKYRPYAFTEQGVAMLSSVLHSDRAIEVNVAIMRAFVRLREILSTHKDLANADIWDGQLPPPQSSPHGYSWRFAIEPLIEGPGVRDMDGAVAWNSPRYAAWAALRNNC